MNLDDILCKILFIKKKKRNRVAEEDIEEEYEEVRPKKGKQVSDDIDWNDENEAVVEPLPETFQEEKKNRVPIKIPKGKALINVNKKAWLHIIMGIILVIVNIILLGVGTVGWISRWEEKILVTLYALPSIYVTLMFTWMKIQGEKVEDEYNE